MEDNQKKFDQLCADTAAIRKDLPALIAQGVMDQLNYKVLCRDGKSRSHFDLLREVGGLHTDVQWMGFNGQTQTGPRKTTTLAVDAGWGDTLVQGLRDDIKKLATAVNTQTGAK